LEGGLVAVPDEALQQLGVAQRARLTGGGQAAQVDEGVVQRSAGHADPLPVRTVLYGRGRSGAASFIFSGKGRESSAGSIAERSTPVVYPPSLGSSPLSTIWPSLSTVLRPLGNNGKSATRHDSVITWRGWVRSCV